MNAKEKLLKLVDSIPNDKIEEFLNSVTVNRNNEINDFLFDCFNDKIMKFTGEKEITFYNEKYEWMYQQDYKNGYLYVSYYRIWSILESKYGLKYEQIKKLINGWVETNTNWRGLTPNVPPLLTISKVETNTNWRGLTPCPSPV